MKLYWVLPVLTVAACATPRQQAAAPTPPPPCEQTGVASWYRVARQTTASGETPPPGALVAAHRTLPIGTQVRVTAVETGQTVEVRIADRGPFAKGRVIDLSGAAARQLGMRQDGVAQVRLQVDAPAGAACPFDPGT
jgi:rare lipoprotein A